MRHRHAWCTIDAHFSLPDRALTKVSGASDDLMLAIMYGLTTVTQTCTMCGEARSYTVSGNATHALDTASTP